jgi:HEAT repeat protein
MKALKFCIAMLALCGNGALASQTYSLVQGIDKFDGSAAAWRLLETNGFVVADPAYKQIFEPYLDPSLPPFITTDSAWDTYQMLLAAGVKQLESTNQPDADFFGNTIEPKIPGRTTASGLDFLVASPELRSLAAVRALRQVSGEKVEKAVEDLNYVLPSNSLAAQSLRLLASLQKPVPDPLAPAFRSAAWADAQLWTQLGAWIDQNHPRQFHSGISDGVEPMEDAPKGGVVAPYPDFFAGLAQLARETEAAMEKAGMDEPFDSRAIAQRLLDGIFMEQNVGADRGEEMAKMSTARIQFNQFAGHYMETHHAGGGDNSPAAQLLLKDLEAVARRCLAGDVPSGADRIVLQGFFDERMTAPRLLRDFATTCDMLAELARKQVDGTPLTEEDEKWIADYGMTLARFHFFPGNSSTGAEEDFPIIRRLGANTAGTSVLWAGLGHPEALYIILPAEGRLRLYRGAVLAYREFIRPGSDSLDDKSWRGRVQTGNAPPTPALTASFRAEKNAADILETLGTQATDPQGYRDIEESLEALQSRVNDADLPMLIGALAKTAGAWPGSPVPGGIAAAIAKLKWEPLQEKLLALIDKDDGIRAGAVASILLQRPEWLDAAALSTNFDRSATRSRRVYALLLGRVQPTGQTRATLLRALGDDAPGVRWQAVLAVGEASWDVAQKIPPLLDRLNDSNELVAAAAACSLGKIGAASVAPVLFSNLEQRLEAPAPGAGALQEQCEAVQDNILGNINGQSNPFDPDNLLGRAQTPRMRRFAMDVRRDPFTVVTALIEALGDLHYQPAADTILGLLDGRNANSAAKALRKLAPEKLAVRLITIASDKAALPQARDDALLLLSDTAGASPMAGLIPLLDDHTVVPGIRLMPGREWRICDRAATTLAALMGRPVRMAPMMPTEQRDEQIEQIRQWLKSAY